MLHAFNMNFNQIIPIGHETFVSPKQNKTKKERNRDKKKVVRVLWIKIEKLTKIYAFNNRSKNEKQQQRLITKKKCGTKQRISNAIEFQIYLWAFKKNTPFSSS